MFAGIALLNVKALPSYIWVLTPDPSNVLFAFI